MNVHPIRTEADYDAALGEVEKLWGSKVGHRRGSLDVLLVLIDDYESKHHPIGAPDAGMPSSSEWSR
jgi:HTH-type transcriptional regulator/antitoxin HigA